MAVVKKIYYGAGDTGPCSQYFFLYDSSENLLWSGTAGSITPSDFSGGWSGTASPQTNPVLKDADNKSPGNTSDTVAFEVDANKDALKFTYDGTTYVMGIGETTRTLINESSGDVTEVGGYTAEQRYFATGMVMQYLRSEYDGILAAQDATYSHARNVVTLTEYNTLIIGQSQQQLEQGENEMSEVNEIPVKSYLNLERDPVNDYHAASKHYVDTLTGNVNTSLTAHSGSTTIHVPTQNTAGYVFLSNATATSAGTWTAYGTASTDVADGGTKLVTGGAVYAYINELNLSTSYAAKSHTHTSSDITGTLNTAAGITSSATALTQGKAVYLYVQNSVLNKAGSGTNGSSLSTTSDTTVPTSKLVYQYVAKKIADAASNYAGATHSHAGSDITSGTVGADYLPKGDDATPGIVQLSKNSSNQYDAGLNLDSGELSINAGNGLEVVAGANPIQSAVQIKLDSESYLSVGTSGLKVDYSTLKADLIGTTEGKAPALDSAGKLSISVMPARVIGGEYLGEVSNQAGMTGKTNATVGDFVKRTDKGTYWMLGVDGDNAYATAANWFEYAGAVASVNGQVGTVSLSASDVSAIATSALVTTVASNSTNATVPSALAVYTFVNDNYAPKTHNHTASEITSGTLAAARLPDASASAKGGVILAKAASSGTTDMTNDTKAVTPKAAKQIADAAAASATAAAAKGKIFTITGDGSTTDFTCTHGLGISNVLAQVYDSDGKQVLVATEKTSTTVTFKFASAPTSSTTYTAVILGVAEAS